MTKTPLDIVVIAHNIRSNHNVGSIFRSSEGFGVSHIYLSGYSPYPNLGKKDTRLPYVIARADKEISKTALGAEALIPFSFANDISATIKRLKSDGYHIVALEQTHDSQTLFAYEPASQKIALVLGEEVKGVPDELLSLCYESIEIPMYGQKESFNVSVATGIALFRLRQTDTW